MSPIQYKFQALKNITDALFYALIVIILTALVFIPANDVSSPLLADIITLYRRLSIWGWLELLLLFLATLLSLLSLVSAYINLKLSRAQQKIDAIQKTIDEL